MHYSHRSTYNNRSYRVHPGSSCIRFIQRRETLQQVLRDQITIAEHLEHSEGRYSRDAAFAWDVVEEISRKLRLIDMHIDDCLAEDRGHDRMLRDDEISLREYDV